ncbi:HAD family hydrolase [Jannaschia sp. 2305UL9-9]|uniref:HAD family hydrolase n=1 Tax=Jannaschia sp. 2305UL9-9 TaxID=3121638 RepID=UPI003527ECED
MTVEAVVWDIGDVLVEWRPALAWSPEIGLDAAHAFIERIDFAALNLRADGGERFADLAQEVADPDDRARLAAYPALYVRTVQGRVPGSWDILHDLKATGVQIHAITNWSAETWAPGTEVHPELDRVFGTLVVSGREGLIKPDPAIFRLLCDRAGLSPEQCLFVDDKMHNVDGARAIGMAGHHFTGAAGLRQDLVERGLL